jgi:DNA polymerase-3 subunit epsilon
MQRERPLLFLDVEATGLSVSEDRVIQIGMVELPIGSTTPQHMTEIMVNPGRPIPEAVTKLTGIKDADVSTAETFGGIAAHLARHLSGFDLVGFNLLAFDVPILAEEFLRYDVEPPFDQCQIIDCGTIFKRREERTLAAAVRFYCGKEATGCHNAVMDANHTHDVLMGQIAKYGFKTVAEASAAGKYPEDRRIDYAGKLSRDAEGHPIYTFGARTKGIRVADDIGFARWILDRDFPLDTKRKLKAILEKLQEEAMRTMELDSPY